MIVAIASGVIESLLAHAAADLPREACGLLIGRPGHIEAAVPAKNASANPDRAFEIDPAMLLRTHRTARADGRRVIGHYHSHPNASPEPSLRDAAAAIDNGQLWLIIAAGTVSAWRVTASDPGGSALHGRFLPVTLEPA